MDDLAQYSPRRRPRPEVELTLPFPSPIRFTLAPPVPLARPLHDANAWRPRLG
jgi:hypothetical protein